LITIKRAGIEDIEFVEMVMNHSKIHKFITDDFTENIRLKLDNILRYQGQAFIYIIPMEEEKMGFFLINQWNSICYEWHSAILPPFRGKKSVEAGKVAIGWVWENIPALKLVTHVPFYNRKAYAFARSLGGELEGINRRSFMKNGVLYDQYLFGLTKEVS